MPWEQGLLTRAGAALGYPPAPDLRAGVLSRLGAPRRIEPARWPFAIAAGAGVLLIVLAAVVALSASARESVASFLGLAVENERIEILPTPPAEATATPFPTATGIEAIAEPIGFEEAEALLGFEIALPAGHGEPASVYLLQYFRRRAVILRYPSFDLWETREIGLGKGVISVEEVTVNGRPAYWLDDEPHIVDVLDASGEPVVAFRRVVAARTLAWRGAETNYRIEANDLGREEAIAIAESLP
jgi:hypothetical protein